MIEVKKETVTRPGTWHGKKTVPVTYEAFCIKRDGKIIAECQNESWANHIAGLLK